MIQYRVSLAEMVKQAPQVDKDQEEYVALRDLQGQRDHQEFRLL